MAKRGCIIAHFGLAGVREMRELRGEGICGNLVQRGKGYVRSTRAPHSQLRVARPRKGKKKKARLRTFYYVQKNRANSQKTRAMARSRIARPEEGGDS